MRFYILSDLHLRAEVETYKISERIKRLCSKIRQVTDIGENVLFVILGDIADKGEELSFTTACDNLSLIVLDWEFMNTYLKPMSIIPMSNIACPEFVLLHID